MARLKTWQTALLLLLLAATVPARAQDSEPERAMRTPSFSHWNDRPQSLKGSNLVLAPIGDNSVHEFSWLDASSSRTFDILAIYYGSDANFSCTACVAVYRGQGPKWQLIRHVLRSQEWHALHPRYGVVMLADDDVIMSTHVLSEAFRIFRARGLVLAQPSVCDHPQSSTLQPVVNQRKSLFMRYTAFVEIMVPMVRMDVLHRVIGPTLDEAYCGWGLDIVWPFLLGYPKETVGIIDSVCAFHPAAQLDKVSTYGFQNPMARTEWEEHLYALQKFGLTPETMAARGMPVLPQRMLWGFMREEGGPIYKLNWTLSDAEEEIMLGDLFKTAEEMEEVPATCWDPRPWALGPAALLAVLALLLRRRRRVRGRQGPRGPEAGHV